jgi:cbb3-type cytochrome oxidase maturation protein
MSVLYIALPVALALGGLAVLAFVRAARRGQFDDLQTPAIRMLYDDVQATQTSPPPPASPPRT